jgi:hypothetical protein
LAINKTDNLYNLPTVINKLIVYPNPTTGQLTIEQPAPSALLQLYNMYGVVVLSQNLNSTQSQLNIGQLVSGVYVVKVISPQGVWQTQVVKE